MIRDDVLAWLFILHERRYFESLRVNLDLGDEKESDLPARIEDEQGGIGTFLYVSSDRHGHNRRASYQLQIEDDREKPCSTE